MSGRASSQVFLFLLYKLMFLFPLVFLQLCIMMSMYSKVLCTNLCVPSGYSIKHLEQQMGKEEEDLFFLKCVANFASIFV